MPDKRKTRAESQASRMGLLPGEYRLKSLVEVVRPLLSEDSERTIQGYRPPVDHWIVETRRLDGDFIVNVECKGVGMEMPHKVVMKVRDHVNKIMKAQRSDSSRGRKPANQVVTGNGTGEALSEISQEYAGAGVSLADYGAADCTCYNACEEDSHSGNWHTHEGEPCPTHPYATMVG